jgi:hypothetical protein
LTPTTPTRERRSYPGAADPSDNKRRRRGQPGSGRGCHRSGICTEQAAHPLLAGIPHCYSSGSTVRAGVNPTSNGATPPSEGEPSSGRGEPAQVAHGLVLAVGASDTNSGPGSCNTLSEAPTWCPGLPTGLGSGRHRRGPRTPTRDRGHEIPCPRPRRGVRRPDRVSEGLELGRPASGTRTGRPEEEPAPAGLADQLRFGSHVPAGSA